LLIQQEAKAKVRHHDGCFSPRVIEDDRPAFFALFVAEKRPVGRFLAALDTVETTR
jgi:hypothetical protein